MSMKKREFPLLKCIRLLIVNSLLLFAYVSNVNGAAVMSVDLGNEWMKVGVVSPGVPMEIALNAESKRKTPAVLAFRDGLRTFGEDAQNIGVKFPSKAYGYLLDLLGKTIDNPIVDLYRKRFPYYEIIGDKERNTVVFKVKDDQLKLDDGQFKIEELIAQILQKAKQYAQTFTQQTITECVLVVPGYFGQAERSALLQSAELADLKVLQLINDYTAVALNYGVFHRAEINETAQYYIFYDMGAQKTSAAVVSYQLVKDKSTKETNPVIQVLGVGYDRTLGGLDIQLRLRDYLAKEFNAMKKTKTDVFKNPRALAKLFKEAGRLKNVLSANNDHYAQIENLIEDHDFKLQITREQLETLCYDMWPRVVLPLRNALKSAGLSIEVINQVIIFGGGTRVPKVQELLQKEIGQELGKSINSDESATMGAVYKAADLASGFKVKKFIIKDAVLFPIQIAFDRDQPETDTGAIRQIKRILFGQMNSYPQKKVITFNKHTKDFDFYANYADLSYLNEDEISYLGSLNLSQIQVEKVAEILEANKGENVESKGIKAHFTLDDSGLFSLTGIDFVFEKQNVDGDNSSDDDSGTLSKLGSTISKLFSSSSETTNTEKDHKNDETKSTDTKSTDEENFDEKLNQTESNGNDDDTKTNNDTIKPNETVKNETTPAATVKMVTVKIPIEHKYYHKYAQSLEKTDYDLAYSKLVEISTIEDNRNRRESTFNALESLAIETDDKLNQDEYSSCATEAEKEALLKECSTVRDWLYEDGEQADIKQLEERLEKLTSLTNVIYARHWEHNERPEYLKALTGMLHHATNFYENAKNLTKDQNPEKDVFTEVELKVLDKTIKETEKWFETETKEQKKLEKNQDVRLTVKALTDKMAALDREVKYLVNKLSIWRPKKPPTTKKPKKEKVKNESEQTDGTEEINADAEENVVNIDDKGTETNTGDNDNVKSNVIGETTDEVKADDIKNKEIPATGDENVEKEELPKSTKTEKKSTTTTTKKPAVVKSPKSTKKKQEAKTEEGDKQTKHAEL